MNLTQCPYDGAQIDVEVSPGGSLLLDLRRLLGRLGAPRRLDGSHPGTRSGAAAGRPAARRFHHPRRAPAHGAARTGRRSQSASLSVLHTQNFGIRTSYRAGEIRAYDIRGRRSSLRTSCTFSVRTEPRDNGLRCTALPFACPCASCDSAFAEVLAESTFLSQVLVDAVGRLRCQQSTDPKGTSMPRYRVTLRRSSDRNRRGQQPVSSGDRRP